MADTSPAKVGTLAASVVSGESREDQFRVLFETYYRPMVLFFERKGFPNDKAEDLAQDALVRVYRGLSSFSYRDDSSLNSWIFKVATNVYRNAIRNSSSYKRAARVVSLDEAESHEEEGDPTVAARSDQPDALLVKEQLKYLSEALNELPEQMRRCFTLRLVHDLKYREIAAVLDVSLETVKSQLFQARQRLREKLASEFDISDV